MNQSVKLDLAVGSAYNSRNLVIIRSLDKTLSKVIAEMENLL